MRKTKAEICAEVFKEIIVREREKYGVALTQLDVGQPEFMLELYDALIQAGFKGCKIDHPLNRIDYVSRCLALDCHRKNGFWKSESTITYPGITRHYCNIYELRDKRTNS